MLVLKRKANQSVILFAGTEVIEVVNLGPLTSLGFLANKSVQIVRKECLKGFKSSCSPERAFSCDRFYDESVVIYADNEKIEILNKGVPTTLAFYKSPLVTIICKEQLDENGVRSASAGTGKAGTV